MLAPTHNIALYELLIIDILYDFTHFALLGLEKVSAHAEENDVQN